MNCCYFSWLDRGGSKPDLPELERPGGTHVLRGTVLAVLDVEWLSAVEREKE